MIDWNKRTITGRSGKVYHIRPESIPVARWNEFLLQGANIGFNCDFKSLYDSYTTILKAATSGNDVMGAINTITSTCRTAMNELRAFSTGEPPKHIKYAALFCISDDEDITVYDEALIRSKADDWAKIPMQDFFLLSSEVTPLLKDVLRSVYKNEKG